MSRLVLNDVENALKFMFLFFFVTLFCPGSYSGITMDTNIINTPLESL